MAELLAKELEDLETGLEIEVDPATAKLRVRLSGSKEIDVQRQKTVTADPEQLDAEPLRARLRASAERGAAQQEATLQRQLTSELEKQLADIRPELDRATNRATIAALKARAAELGEIREVHEDPGGENVVIRVKV
jgi:hypothetical protein